jgi:putative endonuclease
MLFGHLPSRTLGRRGEWWASWFYRFHGYLIVGRNVRLPAGEIDLIARRGRLTILAEVKTRQSLRFGEGIEAVNHRKRARLILLGEQYLGRHPEAFLRYDIVSLYWTGWRFIVTHIPGAFEPVADTSRPWLLRVR